MRHSIFLSPLVLLGAIMPSAPAQASTIPVPNFSFETPVRPDFGFSYDVPGRVAAGWGNTFTANTDSGSFLDADGSGTPRGAEGSQHLGLQNVASATSADSLAKVVAGRTYLLTVAVGDPFTYSTGTGKLGFKIGDTFVPNSTLTFNPALLNTDGKFTDVSFKYKALAADAGKSLKVYLGKKRALGHNFWLMTTCVLPLFPNLPPLP